MRKPEHLALGQFESRSAAISRSVLKLTHYPVLVLAPASALVLIIRFVPSYDGYGWLVWGHETINLALDPYGAPSWKPGTWLLTTPLALAGDAAPTLWLILVYASALAALWLAYRLATYLAGAVAGVTAVLALLLCHDWVVYTLIGESEPLATAFALAAVDRHLAGQRRLALGLGTVVALIRPEAVVVLGLYIVWLWRREPRARVWAAIAVIALPLLWVVPPALTNRRFGHNEPALNTGLTNPSPLTVIGRGATTVIFPVAILAVLGLVIALRRGRGRELALALAAAVALWTAVVVVMAQLGFAGLQRFMLPVAAAGCVLAGAAVGWTLQWLRRTVGSRSRVIVALALTVIAALFGWRAIVAITDTIPSIRDEQSRAAAVHSLDRAIARARGAKRLLACGFPTADLGFQSTLAWRLDRAVGTVGYMPASDLRHRRHLVLFATGLSDLHGADGRLLARAGVWRIVAVRPRSGCF